MQSIVLGARNRTGLPAVAECYATGVEQRPVKDNPDRFYYSVHLAPDPDAVPVYVFADEAVARQIADALTKASKPVKVSATLTVSSRAVNLDAVSLG